MGDQMVSLLRTGRRGVKAAPFSYCQPSAVGGQQSVGNCLKRDL